MPIPAAVLKMGQVADEALDAMSKQTKTSTEPAAVEPVVSDEPELDKTVQQQQTGAVQAQQPAPQGQQGTQDRKADYDALLERYKAAEAQNKTLQGMFANLNATIKALQSQVVQLQASGGDNKGESGSQKPTVGATLPGARKYITSDEVADFGENVIDFYERLGKGITEAMIDGKVSGLDQRISQAEQSGRQVQTQTFWEAVESRVPGAIAMDERDVNWWNFLDSEDELTRVKRRQIAVESIDSADVERMVKLIDLFRGTGQTRVVPAIKPVTSRGDTRVLTELPTITQSEVKKFYEDVARGRYAGKEEQRKQTEQQIEDAASSGRIIPG